MKYLYETHLHTVQSSACGQSEGRSYIRGYKDLGFTGIIVTDHFYNGNSAVNRQLPWREWVNRFCRG
jgi:histidinol phosphatase-like PHP family hydrolase